MVRVRVGLVCFVFTVSIGALAQFEATPGQLVVKKQDYLGTRESSAPREPMIVEQADEVLFVTDMQILKTKPRLSHDCGGVKYAQNPLTSAR